MDLDEFFHRLESKLKSQEIIGDGDLVEYVSDEHIGNWVHLEN
jgi:hypothetical protein